jgi:hypothetical protein
MKSSFCFVFVSQPAVARQRICKHVPMATNAHVTVEELFDDVFSTRSVSVCSERKLCNPICNGTDWPTDRRS